jgi:pSer/pThr/pTyr-binding forkhead associated (FHA) protein
MMRDQGDLDQDQTSGSLWAEGDMMFRVAGAGAESDRLVKVRRPFALVGRAGDSDIAIDDRAVSSRHAYLHLDPRGVYAVDLVTRTGTRINGSHQMVGWLRPGDWIEVAGRRL